MPLRNIWQAIPLASGVRIPQSPRQVGGIGRHPALAMQCREAYGFESRIEYFSEKSLYKIKAL